MPNQPLTTRRIHQSPGVTVIEFTDAEGDREWRAAVAQQEAAELLKRSARAAVAPRNGVRQHAQ